MPKWIIKGLKRCPFCDSSNIYHRVRTVLFEKGRRKVKKNFIKGRIKQYRCNLCKCEFDSPIVK